MAFENNAMRISELLCSSPRSQEEEKASLPSHDERDLSLQVQTPVCTFTTSMTPKFVPDKERKRPYRMSAAQRQHRQECEAFKSRVYNLTLDINELRQQIQRHLNRLLLNNQRFEGDVLNMAWRLLDGLRGGAFGLTPSSRSMFSSRTHVCQRDAAASGAVHQYVMQRGRPTFSRPTFGIKSIRVVALVDRLTPGDKAREIRYVCGSDASCVVEVLANVTGQIT
ncbi:unnamed protein product [Phytophthora lilii]|uniref:Unnamed protein product n=1 Tax=Phytophthora lilii TaxID=2077276 RepID=A0A9W6TSY0_9STRA|nr:unnamed protein product [Phytophthora lilii]